MPDTTLTIQTATIAVTLTDDVLSASVLEQPVVVTIPAGMPGPQGPAGPEGGSSVTYPAGQVLSSGRGVIIDAGEVFYFQPGTPVHAGRLFGITQTSASNVGDDVDIQLSGVLSDAAFAFTGDLPVWVGDDGELSETPPVSGLLQQAGASIGASILSIQITQTLII